MALKIDGSLYDQNSESWEPFRTIGAGVWAAWELSAWREFCLESPPSCPAGRQGRCPRPSPQEHEAQESAAPARGQDAPGWAQCAQLGTWRLVPPQDNAGDLRPATCHRAKASAAQSPWTAPGPCFLPSLPVLPGCLICATTWRC